jgi:hypothetical protein
MSLALILQNFINEYDTNDKQEPLKAEKVIEEIN